MLNDNTPLERYYLDNIPVLVKREDLSCPSPGPPFSKVRGALAHIQAQSANTIGVLDTYHSKAGWAVAWLCRRLGRKCVNYWPLFMNDPCLDLPRVPQQNACNLGAEMISLPAGRSFILYSQARKHLTKNYPDSYMMPNALKLPESITANAAEVLRTDLPPDGTMVLSISSGTIAAGVVQGLQEAGLLPHYEVVIHMGYSRKPEAVLKYLEKASGVTFDPEIIDEGYSYRDAITDMEPPFPCSQYYDLKAWKWLSGNVRKLRKPIVFWNVGE